ncbi:MAG: hypothetical protein ISR59_04780 [Anaerolineales bacterium]|uniref:Alpha/beta hydrolase n=1 Tax=Candidatus Desulfolinea nitratireducens TaxID=2841698 RepID=A0A8J6NNE0_9CHLR|nr:hypothetical protein [Candidatus Desulfolinea nitratireducens]MBL6960403.1 hypothetical protein [Anaerolineales bacterium]
MKTKYPFCIVLLLALVLASCGGGAPVPEASDAPPPVEDAPPPALEPSVDPEPTAVPEPDFVPLPPDAQRMEFEASDGASLVGYYYPASVPDAPVVVLMHWAGGDQTDWQNNGMIAWLQNRGVGGIQKSSRQSAIYPVMPEDTSFAVFTFDFRGFGESSGSFSRDGGLLDAKTAYEFVKTIEGVDPSRIAGIGSSIGSDGVVDGCAEGCLGALSLSPGSYLTLTYSDEVKRLDAEKKPVTCIASEGDGTSAAACNSAAGTYYKTVIYPGRDHGDELLQQPNIPEGIGQVILDWLMIVFEMDV